MTMNLDYFEAITDMEIDKPHKYLNQDGYI